MALAAPGPVELKGRFGSLRLGSLKLGSMLVLAGGADG